ncbi:hypothetical protein BH11PSE2_BH11PSE2_16690 [soil metagenome]
MGAVIGGISDTLDIEVAKFDQVRLPEPLYINSVPKGGTHLIRNIVRMFVPVEQHYRREFIQIPNLQAHIQAFSKTAPMMSCGHMLFADDSVRALAPVRHVVLIRDPYDWVLARARFFLSDEFQQANLAHLKTGQTPALELLNLMIFGIHQKTPSLLDIYLNNAVAWMGTSAVVVRYEDIMAAIADLDSAASERFFRTLIEDCGITRFPDDWRERVRIGSDPKQSRTARINLNLSPAVTVPTRLPETQRKLVEALAPGLRSLLGYA